MAANKAKTKTKADVEKELNEALSALKSLESTTGGGALDLACLGDKGAKQAGHFLEKASAKRQVDPEKILAACLNYCATLSQRRHGIHYVLQSIEQTTRCKIR